MSKSDRLIALEIPKCKSLASADQPVLARLAQIELNRLIDMYSFGCLITNRYRGSSGFGERAYSVIQKWQPEMTIFILFLCALILMENLDPESMCNFFPRFIYKLISLRIAIWGRPVRSVG